MTTRTSSKRSVGVYYYIIDVVITSRVAAFGHISHAACPNRRCGGIGFGDNEHATGHTIPTYAHDALRLMHELAQICMRPARMQYWHASEEVVGNDG